MSETATNSSNSTSIQHSIESTRTSRDTRHTCQSTGRPQLLASSFLIASSFLEISYRTYNRGRRFGLDFFSNVSDRIFLQSKYKNAVDRVRTNIPPPPRKQLCTRSCSNKHTQNWQAAERAVAKECPDFCCSINIGWLMHEPVVTVTGAASSARSSRGTLPTSTEQANPS